MSAPSADLSEKWRSVREQVLARARSAVAPEAARYLADRVLAELQSRHPALTGFEQLEASALRATTEAITEYEKNLEIVGERISRWAASRGSGPLSEEVRQETLLLMSTDARYAHAHELEEMTKISFGIAWHKLQEVRRKDKEQQIPEGMEAAVDTEGPMNKAILLKQIKSVLSQLEPRCRQIFDMKLKGFSFDRIMKALGADTKQQVYNWDNRCWAKVRELLKISPRTPTSHEA